MKWKNEVLKFLGSYEAQTQIGNSRHSDHTNRNLIHDTRK